MSGVASTHLIIVNDSLLTSIQRNEEEQSVRGERTRFSFTSFNPYGVSAQLSSLFTITSFFFDTLHFDVEAFQIS